MKPKKKLLKNAYVVNVFTDEIEKGNVLLEGNTILGVGDYDDDMALAANRVREMNGGNAVAADGKLFAEMSLSIGGLMSDVSAEEAAAQNRAVRASVEKLGTMAGVEPFMNMAFISLPVIPHLKITTKGMIDVNKQSIVPLFL